ncbi:hypothetical protein [Thalassospira sp.]|uniref:hypothetical protein n=1 Tax=Thalassospira sp. TaxID=1912094 RepID=UPI001B0DB559|nr:hypothetical protein [Thalassospira sp.]MBO6805778.1 hypothetical protein [Thalassospira sp.]MBO6841392.1 hypothetical protein [Thalassospira sp.]
MTTILDQVFWWIGATVCALGAAFVAVATIIALGYLTYSLVVHYRIACLVRYHPMKTFDCAAYRAFYRFRYTVKFFFTGIPSSMEVIGYGTVFDSKWIKSGVPDYVE